MKFQHKSDHPSECQTYSLAADQKPGITEIVKFQIGVFLMSMDTDFRKIYYPRI